MLAAYISLMLTGEFPAYRMTTYPLDPDAGRVEVECISPNGNVAANQWNDNKYNASDYVGRVSPVFLIHDKLIQLKLKNNTQARGINDKGEAVLFDLVERKTLIWKNNQLKELTVHIPDDQFLNPISISASGAIAASISPKTGANQAQIDAYDQSGNRSRLEDLNGFSWSDREESTTGITVEGLPMLETLNWYRGPATAQDRCDVGYGTHEERGDGPRVVHEYALFRTGGKVVALQNLIPHLPPDAILEEGGRINANRTIAASGYLKNKPALFLLKPIK